MMYLYTGTPGSGKSYHVVKDIYALLRQGKNIISNFDYDVESVPRCKGKYVYLDNSELTVKFLEDFCASDHCLDRRGCVIEGQTYLIIDEAQILFNCRSWNDRVRVNWCNFFSQHRKYGYHVILITQVDRLIDRAIRSLCEYEYRHRKVNNFGLGGLLVALFCFGKPVFISLEYWYGAGEKIGSRFFIGRRKYFDLYNSYKLFDREKDGAGAVGVRGVAEGRGPHAAPAAPAPAGGTGVALLDSSNT